MPLEGVPQPEKTYAILLRNSQPEKVHGKPGQALPLPPSRKKIPPVRPPLNTAFRLNCYCATANSPQTILYLLPYCCIIFANYFMQGTVKELIFTSDLSKSSYTALPPIGVPPYASFRTHFRRQPIEMHFPAIGQNIDSYFKRHRNAAKGHFFRFLDRIWGRRSNGWLTRHPEPYPKKYEGGYLK